MLYAVQCLLLCDYLLAHLQPIKVLWAYTQLRHVVPRSYPGVSLGTAPDCVAGLLWLPAKNCWIDAPPPGLALAPPVEPAQKGCKSTQVTNARR